MWDDMAHEHSPNAECSDCGTVHHADTLGDCKCGAEYLCEGCLGDQHVYHGYHALSEGMVGALAQVILIGCVLVGLVLAWARILL